MKKNIIKLSLGLFTIAALTISPVYAQDQAKNKEEQATSKVFTLSTCPVSGQALGSMGDPVVINHEGREIRLCCQGCVSQFEEGSAAYLEKVDQAMIKEQLPHYPLETCIIGGGKLGSMGAAVNKIIDNRLVSFCCAGCIGKFEASKDENFAKLDQAIIAKQSENYPLETCAVSGGKLGSMGDPVNMIVGNRLIKLCCAGCEGKVVAAPHEYISKLEQK